MHHKKIKSLHLKKMFALNTKCGERMSVAVAGLFLDYSKNRIANETIRRLLKLAAVSGLQSPIKETSIGAPGARIREDFRSAARGGVNGTPTPFIGGVRHVGGPDMLLAAP